MAKRSSQQTFEGLKKPNANFGGSLLKNSHAKTKRPLESKLPIHLVLRSTKGVLRLTTTVRKVNNAVGRITKKHGVTVYKYANAGNHLHLLIKIPGRARWSAFIRELTGQVAQVAQDLNGQEKGAAKFWAQRPFTSVVGGWRKAFQNVKEYIHLNLLEAEGILSRRDFKTLKDLRIFYESCWI